MYGNVSLDLDGPKGKLGQYCDIPDKVSGLFGQGLAQLFGFNNREALRSFSAAAQLSPDCALCHWGVAMCLAPNINYHVEDQTKLNSAGQKAADLASVQPSLQKKTLRLIAGAVALKQDPSIPDSASSPARAAFAKTMCAPLDSGDKDVDIDAICAGALMSLSPWNYYDTDASYPSSPLKPALLPAKVKLENATAGPIPHVLAIHLLIHLLEPTNAPSSFRWEALRQAEALFNSSGKELVPGQGHLTHMPAHLFLRVGHYYEAVQTSMQAVVNNKRYIASCLNPYAYGHNLKMLIANARFAGMSAAALDAARMSGEKEAGLEHTPAGGEIKRALVMISSSSRPPPAIIVSPLTPLSPLLPATACVDCAGIGSPELILTLARLGRWNEVLQQPQPASWGEPRFAAYREATYYYARALAFYATSGNGKSQNQTAVLMGDLEGGLAVNASARDKTYATLVPAEVHAARAWWVDKDVSATVEALQESVKANDAIPYLEPPRWYYPPRHCLAFALLSTLSLSSGKSHQTASSAASESSPSTVGDSPTAMQLANESQQALDVLSVDLGIHPNNTWALVGTAQALDALGRGDEAAQYRERAVAAWQHADIALPTSPCPQLQVR
jgi:tetratricopeptide (TPR) repeat protein